MGRLTVAAALAALGVTWNVAADEYEAFTDDALGVTFEVPPGYEVERPVPAEDGSALTLSLNWPEGPYAGLDAVVVRRDAAYANVVFWAGFYQRRLGVSRSFEAEAERLTKAELKRAGAADGLRTSYLIGEGDGRRRVRAAFLASGNTVYRLEVSYPDVGEGRPEAAARKIVDTFGLLPAAQSRTGESSGIGEKGEPVPAE